MVPASMAELDAYYERMRPQLYACAEAEQALVRSFVPDIPVAIHGPEAGRAAAEHAGLREPAALGAGGCTARQAFR